MPGLLGLPGYLLKQQTRLIEIVARNGYLWLPLARKHVFAVVVVVVVTGERLFGAVVQRGNATGGVEELQADR